VADASYPDHTWRLAFAYDGDKVDLVRAERIEMIAPPVVTPPPEANAGGFWLEVRDKQGNLIYHRPLYNPLRRHVEHFGDKAGDQMQRTSPESQRGEFDVLVPDLPDGAQFSVHGAPVTPTAAEPNPSRRSTAIAGARDTTLVRHSFDELRKSPK
jgi:hypothetical protein